jgi:hypothetical protein
MLKQKNILYPETDNDTFLQNIGKHLQDYVASQSNPKDHNPPAWEPHIWKKRTVQKLLYVSVQEIEAVL